MTHEKMMEKAWRFIFDMRISDDREKEADYYVESVYRVRDAFYKDLESGQDFEGESLEDFFTRHGIQWEA